MISSINENIKAVFTEEGFTSGNCVYVKDDVRLLIDTGAGSILNQIDLSSIDLLVNTHHHLDHVKGNDFCTSAMIAMHEKDIESMSFPEKISATWGWDRLMDEDLYKCAGIFGGLHERLNQKWRIDETISDGQILNCGKTSVRVLHTPGHTAGHCSFHFLEENLVFLGDLCMTAVGPWYGDENSDIEDFIVSINRIIDIKPSKVITGHRQCILHENIKSELESYRDRIFKREKRIIEFLKKNTASINEIASQKLIYREHPTVFVLFWEKSMVKKHLELCMRKGLVEVLEDGMYQAVVQKACI